MKYIVFLVVLLSFNSLSSNDEKVFLSNTRQLIYEGVRSGEGYFSLDGRYMVFQSEREENNPFYQIYCLDFETGDINRVSTGIGKTTCSYLTPDNKRVIFSSSHLDPDILNKQKEEYQLRESSTKRRYAWDYEPTMDIFIANRDGSNIKQLTKSLGYDAEAAISPDGRYIVFSSNKNIYEKVKNKKILKEDSIKLAGDPSYFCDLFIMDIDGKNIRQLTTENGYDGGPFFSADSKKIIWRKFNIDGVTAEIYTMNIDGSNKKQITDFKSMSWAPFFHPSGEYIIFASNKLGYSNFELFIVDSEGKKEPVQVTFTDGFDGLPVFSNDGTLLSWTSSRTANSKAHIFLANWNHQAALNALKNAPDKASSNAINFTPNISNNEIKAKVEYLASDALEGRMTGSQGLKLAADYIRTIFKSNNITPLQDNYNNDFEFTADIDFNFDNNNLKIGKSTFGIDTNYQALISSESGSFVGDAVFVGYGLKLPDNADLFFDSYAGIDVADKVVFVLDGIPVDTNFRKYRNLGDRMSKSFTARQKGAKGIIFLSKRQSLRSNNKYRMAVKSGLLLGELSQSVITTLFNGLTLDSLHTLSASNNPHQAFSLNLGQVDWKVDVKKKNEKENNIVGLIKGIKQDEYIIVGAHYDHIGHGDVGSRAESGQRDEIHNGADDNASGTALVLELAEYFGNLQKTNPEYFNYSMIFALWAGEEIGLVGSEAFCSNPPIDLSKVKAYLNYDMVGMMENNKLQLQGLGSAEEWTRLYEKKNIKAGLDLAFQNDPYLPTDATSFYMQQVPVTQFFTGLHEHYHRPSDDVEIINFDGIEKITLFSKSVIDELQKPEVTLKYVKYASNNKSSSSASGGFTIYLGTIPDYGAEVEGVKLQGVKAGGPAEKAGMQKGDVIIELDGKSIKNVYDYTNILGELKADTQYNCKVLREGKEVALTLTPAKK